MKSFTGVVCRTMPDARRGFRVPFYPWTPVLAMISCIVLAFYLNANAVITACIFLGLGIVVYYLNKRSEPSGISPSDHV